MKKGSILGVILLVHFLSWAQDPVNELYFDLHTGSIDESALQVGEEAIEKQQDFIATAAPLNINDSLIRAEMVSLGLMQASQADVMEQHIHKYGPLIHIYELVLIPSFSHDWIIGMAPFLSFSPNREKGYYRQPRIRLSSRARYRREFGDSLWNLRSNTRASISLSPSFDASMIMGKGEGEPMVVKGMSLRPELFSAFIRYRGDGLLRQFIMGDYAIQGGAGLRYGSAWSSWNPEYPLADAFRPYRIAGRTSGIEGMLRRGAAMEFRKHELRLDIALSRNMVDGYMIKEGREAEWKGNTSNTHVRSIDFARRARSQVDRNSMRLGIEKEWLRTGISLDDYRISSAVQQDSIKNSSDYRQSLGFDLQLTRGGHILWAEASVLRDGWAGAIAFTGAASSWMSICVGGQYILSSLPVPTTYSLLADAVPSRALYAAIRVAWGDGWAARAGVRRTFDDILSEQVSIEQNAYLVLSRSGFTRTRQKLSFVTKLPVRDDGGMDLFHPIPKIRLSYRFSSHSEPISVNGGMQLSLSRSPGGYSNGLACYLSGRWIVPFNIVQHINGGLAVHMADDADNRAYFWFPGPEGRTIMHQLYHNGWRISLNAGIRPAKHFMIYPGIMHYTTRNTEGELKRMTELGLRLIFNSR